RLAEYGSLPGGTMGVEDHPLSVDRHHYSNVRIVTEAVLRARAVSGKHREGGQWVRGCVRHGKA
ncbi:hypothetical protein JXA88_01465, partial [Candidatus Fermentibacteria bacterium]|nr:hypothetical protein [Candidatus Fermentibacteria bacterium]